MNLYDVRSSLWLYYATITDRLTGVPWWRPITRVKLEACQDLVVVLLADLDEMISDAKPAWEAQRDGAV